MTTKEKYLILSFILLLSLSCQLISSPPTSTPTADLGPQETQNAQALAQATTDARETAEAQLTIEAEGTAEAELIAATSDQETQSALDVLSTATQAQAAKLTRTAEIERQEEATAEVVRQVTAQAQGMADRLQPLLEDGIISSTEGSYHRLEDFDESWAQINWFQWWNTDYSPENFAIRADLFYSSASDKVNWFNSGCGFVFGAIDGDNFHIAQLTFDGYIKLKYWFNGNGNWIAQRPAGNLDLPSGEVEIMMVVSDKRVTFFVNGEEELNEYASRLEQGKLAFTLGSGTNVGYGTRCKMTNVDLWIFE